MKHPYKTNREFILNHSMSNVFVGTKEMNDFLSDFSEEDCNFALSKFMFERSILFVGPNYHIGTHGKFDKFNFNNQERVKNHEKT